MAVSIVACFHRVFGGALQLSSKTDTHTVNTMIKQVLHFLLSLSKTLNSEAIRDISSIKVKVKVVSHPPFEKNM
jgi:hypothetical protein